jgi:hypothetical protein
LKAYVTFRIAATIQVVTTLAVVTFTSGCMVDSVFIIFLALANDLTMLPLSHDNQKASKKPERPVVWNLLVQATVIGLLEAAMSIAFFYIAADPNSGFLRTVDTNYHTDVTQWYTFRFNADATGPHAQYYLSCYNEQAFPSPVPTTATGPCYQFATTTGSPGHNQQLQLCCAANAGLVAPGVPDFGSVGRVCTEITTLALFLQIFISAELLIFPMRTISWMWSHAANTYLYISVLGTCLVFTILAAEGWPPIIPGLSDGIEITNPTPYPVWSATGVSTGTSIGSYDVSHKIGGPANIFPQKLGWANAGYCWLWSLVGLLLVDAVKVFLVKAVEGSVEEIPADEEDIMEMMRRGETPDPKANEEARDTLYQEQVRRSTAARRSTSVQRTSSSKHRDTDFSAGRIEIQRDNSMGSVARRVSQAKFGHADHTE